MPLIDIPEHVNGRNALISYLTDEFELATSKEAATILKVRYPDGEVVFLTRPVPVVGSLGDLDQ